MPTQPVDSSVTLDTVVATREPVRAGTATVTEKTAYTRAVIAHGVGLRDHTEQRMQALWQTQNVEDQQLAQAVEDRETAMAARRVISNHENRMVGFAATNCMKSINSTRLELFKQSVLETLKAQRQIGHRVTTLDSETYASISQDDIDIFNEITGTLFPTGIVQYAEERTADNHTGKLLIDHEGMGGGVFGLFEPNVLANGKLRYALHCSRPLTDSRMQAYLIHEFAHYLEHDNPEITVATRTFYDRRTAGGQITTEHGYEVRDGGFADSYVGRIYDHGGTEVFAAGVEALLAGKYGGLIGVTTSTIDGAKTRLVQPKVDLEHAALILGLLATANS